MTNSMNRQKAQKSQVRSSNLAFLILGTILFTLAYSQAPLFTSNQNQYFLKGLAKAGVGYLSQDWLVNTLDPTPVFSGLIYFSYRLLAWTPIFYLYFGLLAGVYLFSLIGIADEIFEISHNRISLWSFLTLFVGFHAAALRFLLVRLYGTHWAYLFDGGVAGQRLLGEVLQPSTFGVLLLLSVYLFLKRKPYWAILPLVIAPTVHPTYLLSAGVLTAIYMGITLWEDRNLKRPMMIGILALAGVLPIVVHTLLVFQPGGEKAIIRARELLVNFRIPHHALPGEWWDATVVIKLVLILVALVLICKTRVFPILSISFFVAVVLTIVQLLTENHALALLFPWRISTYLVPISLSMILGHGVQWTYARYQGFLDRHESRIFVINLTLTILLAIAGVGILIVNWVQRENSPDRAMMSYALEHRVSGQNYVIPLHMQDFRLETGIPTFVEFKSIPYRDAEVIEWYRRVSMAGRLYRANVQRYGCEALDELQVEGVTHVVLPYDHPAKTCPILTRVYIDYGTYEVFEISTEIKEE